MLWHRPSNASPASASIPLRSYTSRRLGRTAIFVAALAVVLSLCGAPARAWSAVPIPKSLVRISDELYLYTSGGGSVDVTNTYYVVNGQSYVVYQGNPIAVVLNHEDNHIYDMAGNVIGYIVPPTGP